MRQRNDSRWGVWSKKILFKTRKMKHLDCFAGAGGFSLALKQAIEKVETIGFSEIDKFAIQTYQKNFPWVPNFWDISKIDIASLPEFDLLTWWFPCQDVSVAGKQSLEWWRTILVEYLLQMLEIKKPQYFVFENVKGLMSKKFTTFRNSIFDRIVEAGYEYDVAILNTRDFWIPQNRERVFIVWSYWNLDFEFPKWKELQVFLKDILECEVEEKFYLTAEQIKSLANYDSNSRVYNTWWVAPTLNTCWWWHRQVKVWYSPRTREFWTTWWRNIVPTLSARDYKDAKYVTDWQKIRKCTPLEYERLQGFDDNWTEWVSNSQRYKQMWNAISIPPVREIFINLIKK